MMKENKDSRLKRVEPSQFFFCGFSEEELSQASQIEIVI